MAMIASNIPDKKGCGARWPDTRRHAKIYPGRISGYAKLHGVSRSAIGDWIRRGKEVGHLPPLTSPALMARWKRRWYGTRCQARYPKSYDDYAVIHNTSTRAIKRMVKRGKEVRSLPPLGDSAKVEKWRARWMRHVPGKGERRPKQMWLIEDSACELAREILTQR